MPAKYKYERIVRTYRSGAPLEYPEQVQVWVNELAAEGWRMTQIDEGDEEWSQLGPVVYVVIWVEREVPQLPTMEDI